MQRPEEMTLNELETWILDIHEKHFIELKAAASELPRAFWPTYSSFSNTSGGFIILGVREDSPQNEITGVSNVEKILTDLWNQVSSSSKVSYRNIDNQDAAVYTFDGKTVIIIHVKEAPETEKPVYLNGKLEDSYIRTGDGDRHATKEELRSFLRNAQPCQDTLPAEGFTMEDLDYNSLITFRERVSRRYPQKRYMEMTQENFLLEIGGCYQDRITGALKIRRGTILFLGKCNSIRELFPHFHLDFFNYRGGAQVGRPGFR